MEERKAKGEEEVEGDPQPDIMDMNVDTGNKIIAILIKWNRKELIADTAIFRIWAVVMYDDEMLGFLLRDKLDKIHEEEGE